MAEQPLHLRSDDDLVAALLGLGDAIAWPTPAGDAGDGLDLAARVRARIEAAPRSVAPARRRWSWNWRPARRALVVAVIVLLALAALAGAAGLGLPGLRLIFGPAPVRPPPSLTPGAAPSAGASRTSVASSSVPGATMSLGALVTLAELDQRAGFPVVWPDDPAIGPPDAAYLDESLGGQVALVWRSRVGLPDTLEPGVGQVLTAFRGTIDGGFFSKAVGSGTKVELVKIHGDPAYWISGDPHFLFYQGPDGFIQDPRRWVGDGLIWARGPITYRLETPLGRDAAIRLAETMR
ncbi:MAG: hypothetical protein ABI562_04355 [Chloroflexota bacterium]